MKALTKSLLGQPIIRDLKLIKRIACVDSSNGLSPKEEFPSLLHGLGKMEGEYEIQLKDDAEPFSFSTPRRVAIPLLNSVHQELERMERMGVIAKVEQPTEWCSGMVVVPKSNSQVRICVDLTKLNLSVKRERHTLPAVDPTLAQLAGVRVFTKLDANSGFWQIPLSSSSALLTTFITPFGKYYFRRLPFGISSAPEHFQRRMTEALTGLTGTVCLMDDVLIYGATHKEHDERLRKVLERLTSLGITLNVEKCSFAQSSVKFFGHVIDADGIQPDLDKVTAITQFSKPTCVGDVRRFLGMVNQLSKFSPHLAELTQPMRELLVKDNMWVWGEPQQSSFDRVKEALTVNPVLALFDPNLETIVCRRLITQSRSCSSVEAGVWEGEASSVCVQSHDTDGATLRPNRERGAGFHLGLRAIVRLPRWSAVSCPDRPQALHPAVQFQESGRASSTRTEVSNANDALPVHHQLCSWQESGDCRHSPEHPYLLRLRAMRSCRVKSLRTWIS